MASKILVVCEVLDGKIKKTSHSGIAFAKKTGLPFSIFVGGHQVKSAAPEMAVFGADKVLICDHHELAQPLCERFAPTVASLAKQGFDVIVFPASSFGKDVAPRVAAKVSAGYAPDISSVENQNGKLIYKRPVYAGNVYATCELVTPLQVVSVRQSEFGGAEPEGGQSPVQEVTFAGIDPAANKIQFMGAEATKSERPDLGEATTVISGGRPLKEKFYELLSPLAEALGGAIGASRAACDAGYAPHELQVGQTGRVVAPKLYLAVGISGAIQHLAGMKGSKVIVAINKDPEAPIHQVADYKLVQDLFVAVPELIAELKKV